MKWSLTKLKMFEQCPAKYKYRYLDHIQEAKSGAAARGTETHSTVERFLLGEVELPPELTHWHSLLSGLKTKTMFPELKLALDKDWKPVEWGSPDVWWNGVLDLLVLASPEATIYDWKTGKIWPDHDEQKDIYTIATFATHSEMSQVRAIHVYLDLGKSREKVYSRSDMPALQEGWERRVRSLEEATEFIPNPSYGCRWCPFSRQKNGPCRF